MTKKKQKKAKHKRKKPVNAVRRQEVQRSKNPFLVSHIISIVGCVVYVTGLFLPFFYADVHIPFGPQGRILEAQKPFAVSARELFLLPDYIYILSIGLVVFLNILGIVYKKSVPSLAVFILFGCGLEPIYYSFRLLTKVALVKPELFNLIGAGGMISLAALMVCLYANIYQLYLKKANDR